MGWSCNAAAHATLERWTAHCRAQTGMSNTYIVGEVRYFLETSRVEHADGAITGTVMRVTAQVGDTSQCVRAGNFRIDGDGAIVRAPAHLKALGK
jgi:DNA-binding transcriptional regulator PaaX